MSEITKQTIDGGACFGTASIMLARPFADLDISVVCEVEIWMMALILGNLHDMVEEGDGCTQQVMATENSVKR